MRALATVTTSWDDGDQKDIRIAELLRSRGLRGTFYVPIRNYKGTTALTGAELRELQAQGFEIGAHSVSHKDLSLLDDRDLHHEVQDCKDILEQALGGQVSMFCYPNGRYNASVIRRVQRAGYRGARTTHMLSHSVDFRPFEMPTTVQAYPHVKLTYLKNVTKAKNVSALVKCMTQYRQSQSWVDVGKRMFEHVLKHGGIWHLYGHSWEVEQLGIWRDLAELLSYVSHRNRVAYSTNGEILSPAM
jgi:peptidoglycan/xylan/chitin deacetylase (PgdA/CDA1 family)